MVTIYPLNHEFNVIANLGRGGKKNHSTSLIRKVQVLRAIWGLFSTYAFRYRYVELVKVLSM